jgi:hypothetical protein
METTTLAELPDTGAEPITVVVVPFTKMMVTVPTLTGPAGLLTATEMIDVPSLVLTVALPGITVVGAVVIVKVPAAVLPANCPPATSV